MWQKSPFIAAHLGVGPGPAASSWHATVLKDRAGRGPRHSCEGSDICPQSDDVVYRLPCGFGLWKQLSICLGSALQGDSFLGGPVTPLSARLWERAPGGGSPPGCGWSWQLGAPLPGVGTSSISPASLTGRVRAWAAISGVDQQAAPVQPAMSTLSAARPHEPRCGDGCSDPRICVDAESGEHPSLSSWIFEGDY